MNDGDRIMWNELARSTRGIGIGVRGESRHDICGVVLTAGLSNGFSNDCLHIAWDDGERSFTHESWVELIKPAADRLDLWSAVACVNLDD